MSKLIKDGKVAVLISRGFGAGWSTWCYDAADIEFMLFDSRLVQALLDDKRDIVEQLVAENTDEAYTGGLRGLYVEWLDVGTQFIINEYDGSETLQILSPTVGHVA